MSGALLKSFVSTGIKAGRLGFGMETADWHPDNFICIGVKSGCALQNSTAAEWGGGGAVGV
jgi:hypothetical protein